MKRHLYMQVFGFVFGGLLVSATALATPILYITPDNAHTDGNHPSGPWGSGQDVPKGNRGNCEPLCINEIFETDFNNDDLLYKASAGGKEEGSYVGAYSFAWKSNLEGVDLTWDTSQSAINCLSCYLAVKDGSHDPRYYFYDLSSQFSWNGTDTLSLSGFWTEKGDISHVSIWGSSKSTTVPEPGTAALLLTGALGLFAARRRQSRIAAA